MNIKNSNDTINREALLPGEVGLCPFMIDTCRNCAHRYQCQFHWLTFIDFKYLMDNLGPENRKYPPEYWIKRKIVKCMDHRFPCGLLDYIGNINYKVIIDAFKAGELWHDQSKIDGAEK